MTTPAPTALVADDEPTLVQALIAELAECWPELEIVATAGDGKRAIELVFEHRPQIAFLDIRMPGANGLEVAQAIAEDWPETSPGSTAAAPPLIVFVTAHGEFALDAFERAAVDYVLKPVSASRLALTVDRLKARVGSADGFASPDQLGAQLIELLNAGLPAPAQCANLLQSIRASVGEAVRLFAIDDVVLFEASDKYVVVHSKGEQALIRESLRDLRQRLNPGDFVQIHRSAIVNLRYVHAAVRGDDDRLRLELVGTDRRPVVSRMYAHLFKPM